MKQKNDGLVNVYVRLEPALLGMVDDLARADRRSRAGEMRVLLERALKTEAAIRGLSWPAEAEPTAP